MSVSLLPFPNPQPSSGEVQPRPIQLRAIPLGDLRTRTANDEGELLKHRYLCKGGGMLIVGPTGIGKSSFSMQCMMQWALGRPAFDIDPARPLTSLLIQAENDEGDLAEMRDGMVKGLEIAGDDLQDLGSRVLTHREDSRTGAAFCAEVVDPLLAAHKPDLLWIDPALAYLGGESNSQEDVGRFLRNQLNPLINRHQCGVIVVHHTNKPLRTGEPSAGGISDMAYQGTGSAEWANWARAVMVLRSTKTHGIFELHAGKRGSRIRWRDPQTQATAFVRHLMHAKGEGELYWRFATAEEASGAVNEQSDAAIRNSIVMLVPPIGGIDKSVLINQCRLRQIGRDKAATLIKELLESGELVESEVPQKGRRPLKNISRQSQPQSGLQPLAAPTAQPPPLPSGLTLQEDGVSSSAGGVPTAVVTGFSASSNSAAPPNSEAK